jgi:hypothetical protein
MCLFVVAGCRHASASTVTVLWNRPAELTECHLKDTACGRTTYADQETGQQPVALFLDRLAGKSMILLFKLRDVKVTLFGVSVRSFVGFQPQRELGAFTIQRTWP